MIRVIQAYMPQAWHALHVEMYQSGRLIWWYGTRGRVHWYFWLPGPDTVQM